MLILLTNDDGIYADGLLALYQQFKKMGTVSVVAPDGERSSVGHGITSTRPLRLRKIIQKGRFNGYGVDGTPADCVKMALDIVGPKKPDLVVSGINLGANDGCSVVYSGTAAGAREGAMMGIPSFAISVCTYVNPDYTFAAQFALKLAKKIVKKGLPAGTFLNVNIPHIKPDRIKGVLATRQNTLAIHGTFEKRTDTFLKDYFWLAAKSPKFTSDLTNDSDALKKGFITLAPIQCDATDYKFLSTLKDWKI